MNSAISTNPPRARLRAFALGSVLLHGIVLAEWQASPRMAGQANSVISVTLVSDHIGAAPAETRLATQPARQIVRRTDNVVVDEPSAGTSGTSNRLVQGLALLTISTKTKPMDMTSHTEDSRPMEDGVALAKDARRDDAQEAQNPTSPSVSATGEEDKHDQAKAQIQARLNTDLARYFDYPYVARLRGWEGTVLLAFNIEANGRLESIRVARSSGYAVLDDSALSALRKVGRFAETTAWLQGRELAMRIPVIYRLRCPDTHECRENKIAATDPEDR